MLDVHFGGGLADNEHRGNLTIGHALRDQRRDLTLAPSERIRRGRGPALLTTGDLRGGHGCRGAAEFECATHERQHLHCLKLLSREVTLRTKACLQVIASPKSGVNAHAAADPAARTRQFRRTKDARARSSASIDQHRVLAVTVMNAFTNSLGGLRMHARDMLAQRFKICDCSRPPA